MRRLTVSRRPIESTDRRLRVDYCRPRTSAFRYLNLKVGFLAVRSLTLLSLADPQRSAPAG
jgi:hypothetical protein